MSFRSTSHDLPSVLHVSFANYGKKAQLGAQLVNCDSTAILKGDGDTLDKYMFTPGYAVVSKLIGGDLSVAKKSGVEKGDIIIAINGLGFRRYEQDYKDDQVTIIQTHGATKKSSPIKGGGEKTKEGDDDEDEDFHDAKNKDLSAHDDEENYDDVETEEDMDVLMINHRVVPSGNAYKELLSKIKSIKAANGDPPLIITLERYGWDHRPNSWNRFLIARNYNVVNAMQLLQEHELWKRRMFPIDLVTRGMQKLIREKIISEIDVSDIMNNDNRSMSDDGIDIDDDENNVDVIKSNNKNEEQPRKSSVIVKPTDCPCSVYVNYAKLMSLYSNEYIPMDEIIQCFVIYVERILGNVNGTNTRYDVRLPKVNQFIDVTDCTFTGTTSFRIDILKQLYNTFEPNYPETLNKLVIYPVSTIFVSTIYFFYMSMKKMLSYISFSNFSSLSHILFTFFSLYAH